MMEAEEHGLISKGASQMYYWLHFYKQNNVYMLRQSIQEPSALSEKPTYTKSSFKIE